MRALALLVISALATGCAAGKSDDAVDCHVGSECASGACDGNGRCVPLDAGGDAHGSIDGGSGSDAPSTTDSATNADAPTTGCSANHDDVIEAAEVPLRAGLRATFRVATNASVSTAGAPNADGTRAWDLSKPLSGDHDVLVQTLSPIDAWWEKDFSGATYATALSAQNDLLGVFQVDASGVLLRGIVSPTTSPETELTYATPIPSLQFPLKVGAAWKTTSNVTGPYQNVPTASTEAYDTAVDGKGTLVTPFGTFPVLRVRIVLTKQLGAVITVVRSYAFVTECFGTIATVTSNPNETSAEFTTANEVRRLTP